MLAKISPKGLFRTVKTVCGWKHSQLQCKDCLWLEAFTVTVQDNGKAFTVTVQDNGSIHSYNTR